MKSPDKVLLAANLAAQKYPSSYKVKEGRLAPDQYDFERGWVAGYLQASTDNLEALAEAEIEIRDFVKQGGR